MFCSTVDDVNLRIKWDTMIICYCCYDPSYQVTKYINVILYYFNTLSYYLMTNLKLYNDKF